MCGHKALVRRVKPTSQHRFEAIFELLTKANFFLSDEGAGAPFKPPTQGGMSPLWNPPKHILVGEAREKRASFFPCLSGRR